MIEKLEDNRLNELSETIILDYLKFKNMNPDTVVCIDIEGLAKEYFGFEIKYETICEDDRGKVAFSGNGIRPVKICKNGKVQEIVYPTNTIVLDKYFKRVEHYTSRRFNIGHEVAHKILSKVAPGHDRGNYHTIFDKERDYSIDELRSSIMNISENQANQMSAALQMPMFLLKNTMRRICKKDKFTVYGDHQMLPKDSANLKKMADDMGVSPTTLLIRLRGCKLIEHRDIDEYMKIINLRECEDNVYCP